MQQLSFPPVTRPTSLERAHFRDGMIVHADDLDVAMRYPVDMFRMLVRAFFGCGIVCGLEVEHKEDTNFKVIVHPGVAVDCDGYPLELCRKVEINLEPRSSSCAKPNEVSILIRRLTTEESPRRPCGCRDEESPDDPCQGTRVREHVQIKVFDHDQGPERVCKHEPLDGESGNDDVEESWAKGRTRMSDCLRTCGPCCPGGDPYGGDGWVLLADVKFTMDDESNQPKSIEDVDTGRRRYVKPIDCLCRVDAGEAAGNEPLTPMRATQERARRSRRNGQPSAGEAEQQGQTPPT